MQLQKNTYSDITANNAALASPVDFNLPEKVLQFGTGVLLRGLPDFYIDKANKAGIFNGRIVVVKSTAGGTEIFSKQDNLYTHCIKGMENGATTESYVINTVISRVLTADAQWQQVLDCAANPQLQIVISNTTEVGITLLATDDINAMPPQSFPGKLLAFLYKRYQAFNGSDDSGIVIIPTELIVDNGLVLKNIVHQLARINKVDDRFINWLLYRNDWCNSLVDRIVPGALPQQEKQQLQQKFGYTDELAIMSEPYSLWAIETSNERTKSILSFSRADDNIIIADDILKYRELKLRLLNGTHTFSCGLAFLYGFETVAEAMQNDEFTHFIRHIMLQEAVPCLAVNNISHEEAKAFAHKVISRFANPFIQHKWLSITLQYTGKIKLRCVPLIKKYYQLNETPPAYMAMGIAAYLFFMKATVVEEGKYYGEWHGKRYLIQDDKAAYFYSLWQQNNVEIIIATALANAELWEEDLNRLPGFASMVLSYLIKISKETLLKELMFQP